jgi:hypothetical protein
LRQAQWLSNYNRYAFTIEGHADERGTREYNIALGARRAQTVREYLSTRGIAAARMATVCLRVRYRSPNCRAGVTEARQFMIQSGHLQLKTNWSIYQQ